MSYTVFSRCFPNRQVTVLLPSLSLLLILPAFQAGATAPSHFPTIAGIATWTTLVIQGASGPLGNPAEKDVTITIPPPWKPRVVLSSEHRDSCVVTVGEKMPAMELPDLDNVQTPLQKAYGKKLTVIVFWNAEYRYARGEFQHLQTEVVTPFAKAGVSVIAIHTGSPPDNYATLCAKQGKGVICLLDKDQHAFKQIATGKLPRTYLLDAQGSILWLDIEYSRTTRLELHNALRYYLQDRPAAKRP